MRQFITMFSNQLFRLSTFLGATIAANALLSPVAPQTAQADPFYRIMNGRYYYAGESSPGYGYNGYGYNPYSYSGGSYFAAPGYVSPSYQSNGFDGGVGNGVSYNGLFSNGGSRFYGRPVRPAYTPYGFGAYGPYGN